MEFSLLNLLLVLLVAWLSGLLASRMGYPSVLGELLAGIIVGPPLLGLLEGSAALAVLAEVGVLLMMVYIGMEIDPKELARASKAGFLAAIGGFITPFVLCYLAIIWSGGTVMAAIFVGVAAGVTSLATKSRILVDLQLLDTRIAHVMMAGALIADTLSLVLFAAVIGVGETDSFGALDIAIVVGKAALFFGVATIIGLKVLPVVGRYLKQLKSFERTAFFTAVLLIALFFAELAELAGMHGILGAFIAGLFMREGMLGRSLSKEIMNLVRDSSIGFLAPIFFVTAGFEVSLDVFSENLGLLLLLTGLATVGKIVGTALFYLPTGNGWREGITVGAGMNGRGAVEIIVAQIGLTMGLIDQQIFSMLVFMAIFTTATVPVLLKWTTSWLRSRGELVGSDEERKGAVIIGAGPTARVLGKLLSQSQPVTFIDSNKEHCDFARAEGFTAIEGSALDEQTLSDAQASHAKYFIAMTPNAEINALSSQLAKTIFFVPEVHICQHGPGEGHEALIQHIKGATLFGMMVSPEDWDYRLGHDRVGNELVRVVPITIDQPQPSHVLVDRLKQSAESLPMVIAREEQFIPFHSNAQLEQGDIVHVLQKVETSPAQPDRFDLIVSQCTILDIDRTITPDAFFEMAAGIMAPSLELDPAELKDAFSRREKIRSSVLLPGVAIPHVLLEGDNKLEILIARCREGIFFEGDPGGVHILFVIAGTDDERSFHLRTLSAVAQILVAENFELDWMKAADTEALRKLVRKTSRRKMMPSNEHSTEKSISFNGE